MGADPSSPDPGWAALSRDEATPESLLALAAASPGQLSGRDLVDAIVAAEKALSLLSGVQMRLLSALATPFVAGDPMRMAARLARNRCINRDDSPEQMQHFVAEAASNLAAAEVAAALRISPVTGGIRVREAETMTTDLAPTLLALESGRLDRGKARVIAEHCRALTAVNALAVQDLVLGQADMLTTSGLRDATAQAVIIVDPVGAEERHEEAAARRELTLRAQPDAMATLTGFLPADGAVKIFQISDLLATGTAGDSRGIGARRIDALVDIADQLLTHGHLDLSHFLGATNADDDSNADGPGDGDVDPPEQPRPPEQPGQPQQPRQKPRQKPSTDRVLTRQGRRPHLSVTVGLGTLAGIDQLPGVLAGFGAIPATLARAIATSAGTVSAVITDPASGTITAAGDLTYRPRQQIRDRAAELFNGCQFPSCRQPVWRCELDHRVPFDNRNPRDGGPTTSGNTGPLCERHHLMKHHTDWRMHVNPADYVLHFTSPTGHRYTSTPRPPLTLDLRVESHRPSTAITEKLDVLALFANASNRSTSSIMERLASLLLRHHLNQPPREYVPDPTIWETANNSIPPPEPADDLTDANAASDEPPF